MLPSQPFPLTPKRLETIGGPLPHIWECGPFPCPLSTLATRESLRVYEMSYDYPLIRANLIT
jgi:hypothetical protein